MCQTGNPRCWGWVCGGLAALLANVVIAQALPPSSAEVALESIFSPWRAPAEKTMGLVQRSFLDIVEISQPRLEVAMVVDGTDSMGAELEGIRRAMRQMVDDLRRYKENNVSFQLVIYRDAGADSGEVTMPLKIPNHSFTNDEAILLDGFQQIQPETGAPYFPELIDLGIHKALTELNWSRDSSTSRWLFVFGDAPPFEQGFEENESKARRRIATDQLVGTAVRLGIKINCVLCKSRSEDQSVYEQVLNATREFMNTLATDTGGLMLDLSYPDIRSALEKAAKTERVTYQKIGRMTREDIEKARREAISHNAILAENRRARIAILPHMPLSELSFDPRREEVQISTELRHRFRNVPGIEVKSPVAIERQVAILRGAGVRGDQMLQALATGLNVDYIVWGNLSRTEGVVEIQSVIYEGVAGRELIRNVQRSGPQLPVTDLSGRMAADLMQETVRQNVDRRLVSTFARLRDNSELRSAVVSPVARTNEARSDLLTGFEALEQALAYPVASPQADKLLELATASLRRASGPDGDATNPLAHLLLANCYLNQGRSLMRRQQSEEAEKRLSMYSRALKQAYLFRNESEFAYIKREIEADYALLIKKDVQEAIQIYEALSRLSSDVPLHVALRAHWMLAGIYSGDWGVAQIEGGKGVVDAEQARKHLIQILAHWEDSSEAQFVRKNLRWDEVKGENRFEHFPRANEPIAVRTVDT